MKGYPLLKVRDGNIETFSIKQLRSLLNAPNKRRFTGVRDYTYLLLLLETGIRLSEATAIQVEDVKQSEGVIFVRHTKNDFHRYVPIQAKMKEQLRRYMRLRGTCETNNLFVTLDGGAMQRQGLQSGHCPYCACRGNFIAGLPPNYLQLPPKVITSPEYENYDEGEMAAPCLFPRPRTTGARRLGEVEQRELF